MVEKSGETIYGWIDTTPFASDKYIVRAGLYLTTLDNGNLFA